MTFFYKVLENFIVVWHLRTILINLSYGSKKTKASGCFGIIAFLLVILGAINFLMTSIQGGHKNDYGEWVLTNDMYKTSLFIFGITIVCYIIDRMRY